MLEKAAEFNCSKDDIACMCKATDWNNGIRDCSVESCPSIDQANVVISWGNSLCSGVGVTTAVVPTATSVKVSTSPSPEID